MGDSLKSVGSSILGIGIFLGIILLAIMFIKGGVWVSAQILPWLSDLMWIVVGFDILIMLPLAIFRKTRVVSAIGLLISSYVYGLGLWCWALLMTYLIWGVVGVLIGLLCGWVGVVPIAMLATAINGEWEITVGIVILLVLTSGAGMLGMYLAEKSEKSSKEEYTW